MELFVWFVMEQIPAMAHFSWCLLSDYLPHEQVETGILILIFILLLMRKPPNNRSPYRNDI